MDINIYVVSGCVLAIVLAFLTVYFCKKWLPVLEKKVKNIKDVIKDKVGVTVYANLEHTIVSALYAAEDKFNGYIQDKYGINRHNFAKKIIKMAVKELGIANKVKDEHIDLIIKFYVQALKLAKGENPFK